MGTLIAIIVTVAVASVIAYKQGEAKGYKKAKAEYYVPKKSTGGGGGSGSETETPDRGNNQEVIQHEQ